MKQNQVEILYFAMLQEAAHKNREFLNLDEGITAQTLYHQLEKSYAFTLPFSQLRVAINDRFAPGDTILHPGDKIAFIPPVSGG